jgi:hypothetical protein
VSVFQTPHERAEAYRNAFTGPTGEKVLEDLRAFAYGDRTSFDPNPYVAAFNEGQRALVVAIANTIKQVRILPATPPDEEDA